MSSKRLSVESVAAESKTVQNSGDEVLSSNKYFSLINGLKQELDGATYYSDKIFDDLYPPVPSQNSFCNEFMEDFPGFSFSSPTKASRFFEPLTMLLNSIKQKMKQQQLLEHSIYKDIEFEIYNGEMMDSPLKDKEMKPQVIARIPPSSKTASWKEVEFFIQVDSDFPLLVAHAAKCFKTIFKLQRNRLFALGIFFDHHTYEISFGISHASGLIFPRKRYKLNEVQGYQEFVQAMVRVYSSSHSWRAGFDETCDNEECHISGFGTYLYIENLSYHAKVGGCRTRVDKLKLSSLSKSEVRRRDPQVQKHALSKASPVHNVQDQDLHDDDIQRPSKRIKSEEISADSSITHSVSIPASLLLAPFSYSPKNAPETLILKDSWPLRSRWDTETNMFQAVEGYFGIPKVYPGYRVKHSNIEEETDFFVRNDLEKYDVSGGNCRNHEPRVHVRLPIVTEGVPLTEAGSPRILVLGILHAIVGHWHLFKAGWLHRDVSIGNILLRKIPISGLKIEGLNLEENSSEYFSECTSFITDGDLAVRWKEERSLTAGPSGTRPFMSIEMLYAAAYPVAGIPPHTHTAVDDLESFIWVLIWAILDFVPKSTWTALESRVHHCFESDMAPLSLDKEIFLERLERATKSKGSTPHISSGLKVFAPLLIDWLTESKQAVVDILNTESGPPNGLDFYEKFYQNYVSLALKSIDNLPDSWDYLGLQT